MINIKKIDFFNLTRKTLRVNFLQHFLKLKYDKPSGNPLESQNSLPNKTHSEQNHLRA